eukprot:CAMPEP_0171346754 /NCGR_PEP_ID=MMETSP0878-20121228/25867_1 /TAXON_ID=67004 /ORGANISM="Thalassiosira weissflogii, Strain CCMP1336" /LENGTH=734 /DNA_ID=CAMNT_0011850545 /DNA_START=131 /DNA_END=2335 /DNA_ORIENTATION=+
MPSRHYYHIHSSPLHNHPNHHHHHHNAEPPEPLATLRVADSIFLGYVCTHRSLPAIEQYRDYLAKQIHPEASHVPFSASVENSSAVSLSSSLDGGDDDADGRGDGDEKVYGAGAGGNEQHGEHSIKKTTIVSTNELLQEGYDEDGEPTGSSIGKSLLFELTRYKRLLRRQSTIKIRGSQSNAVGAREDHLSSFDVFLNSQQEKGKNNKNSNNTGGNHNDDNRSNSSESNEGTPIATAIIIVRYFKKRLLGVTCGRLNAVYARTARLALHRHLHGRESPYVERYTMGRNNLRNLYGLGAGDTELIVGVVPLLKDGEVDEKEDGGDNGEVVSQKEQREQQDEIIRKLMSELHFEGMVGSKNELLPRLQNLQADLPIIDIFHDTHTHKRYKFSDTCTKGQSANTKDQGANIIIPIYRYPGNYSGTEWPTHQWSPTTLAIKRSVEKALRPLYDQHMNHCVSNLYRDGYDRIDHHSDKDLDLNRHGVIISVSLGSTRVMELRDREYPHDVARVDLPPGSMFVLGPFTNARFTHAVLPVEGAGGKVSYHEGHGTSDHDDNDYDGEEEHMDGMDGNGDAKCSIEFGGRISLTFRDVRTFLDVKTQRLFGQGVRTSAENDQLLVQDGMVTKESLSRLLQQVRQEERRDSNQARLVSSVIGIAVGYVTTLDKSAFIGKDRQFEAKEKQTMDGMSFLRSVSFGIISASASYWYLRYLRSEIRRRREEKDAREFFSKKSASGNRY